MENVIPAKKSSSEAMDKPRRFYVELPVTEHLELQKQAFERDCQPHQLGGAILSMWLSAGSPESIPPVPSPVGAAHVAREDG